MSFEDEFVAKAKEYLKEDKDANIMNEVNWEIAKYFNNLNKEIGEVKNDSFSSYGSKHRSYMTIDNRKVIFETITEDGNYHIQVTQGTDDTTSELDIIYVQEGKMYSQKEEKEFDMDIVRNHLQSTFGDILGL
ncbi:DUF3942 family protein [Marinococcus luteus]|uniref:DUF3942 family protein n=1 Tax=Marinococcus luteus TaxID=1122204 RepID=UPI002ACC76D4|nr:DUF3942 family protein [Marinococcus luteus]MDZ5781653.1 DUF3942 family protein [Marinococcus luteus]